MLQDVTFTVGEFVAILNQTLEFAYPGVTVTGEVANFRVSKGRWVYFDLKDDQATVRFFGTVYQLPGPLEDGMKVAVRGLPRLHQQYGFSVNIQTIRPVGEGSIKKAAQLLQATLAAEGLFDEARKRPLPYPPHRIGLITSAESAAYRDFVKVLNARWGGLEVILIDVQVQGEAAPVQIAQAIEQCNRLAEMPEVLVITRGGGSAEDLQAFSTEQVTRAVAASRIPTLVAIGHEVDVSLAELAADLRASTPSNAAELLVPDRKNLLEALQKHRSHLHQVLERTVREAYRELSIEREALHGSIMQLLLQSREQLTLRSRLLQAYNPQAALSRGYALLHKGQRIVRSGREVAAGDVLSVQLYDSELTTEVKGITIKADHE